MSKNIGCLGRILKSVGLLPNQQEERLELTFPYRLRDDFLSPHELSFYKTLLLALEGQNVTVFVKVSLGDLFFVKHSDYKEKVRYWNKINRKHVDFLICQSDNIKPLLGIELDDTSHERKDRKARDEFVNHVFESAQLHLLHIKANSAYSIVDLKNQLNQYLKNDSISTLETKNRTDCPICPKCQIEMVICETKKGQRFYGCTNFPHCRETTSLS